MFDQTGMQRSLPLARWSTVGVFAIAMAWVEAAVVFYLRTMVNRIEPYQTDPLPLAGGLGQAELVREAATLIMLLTVGILAGSTWRARLGYSAIAFGIWDIFYYVFLKILCGWPHSVFDWDVLFLLPLPWWGPVLAPVAIAALMILWGALVTQGESLGFSLRQEWMVWTLNFAGGALALAMFMADAARVADQGTVAIRRVLPQSFNWPIFLISLALMAAPILQRVFKRKGAPRPATLNPIT